MNWKSLWFRVDITDFTELTETWIPNEIVSDFPSSDGYDGFTEFAEKWITKQVNNI